MGAIANDKSSAFVSDKQNRRSHGHIVDRHCANVHGLCNVINGTKVVGLPTFRKSPKIIGDNKMNPSYYVVTESQKGFSRALYLTKDKVEAIGFAKRKAENYHREFLHGDVAHISVTKLTENSDHHQQVYYVTIR